MWANSGQEISLPGLVVSFPDENKRSINTTGKIRKVPFAVLQENSGQILLVSANCCSLHWRQRQKSTLKWLSICYTCGSVAFQFFYYSVLSYFRVTRFFIQRVASTPYLTGGRGWCAWRGRRMQGCWPTSLRTGDSAQRLWRPWSSRVGSHQPKELPVSCPACTSLLQHLQWFAWEAWNWDGWSFGPRQYSHPYFVPEDAQEMW